MKFNVCRGDPSQDRHCSGCRPYSQRSRKALGASYIDFWSHYGRLDPPAPDAFHPVSNYDLHVSGSIRRSSRETNVRILHLIRDPRDVLISAMHYHKTADEAWLHIKRCPGCNDIPYQRQAELVSPRLSSNTFSNWENASSSTIEDMLDWRYDRAQLPGDPLRGPEAGSLDGAVVANPDLPRISTRGEQKACKECFWKP